MFLVEGVSSMSNNFIELLSIILESGNPEQAVHTAANVIFGHLSQHESHQEEISVCRETFSQTNLPSR